MQGVITLPRGRIHKKQERKRLSNLPGNLVESFYKDWLDGIDFSMIPIFKKKFQETHPAKT